MENLEITKRKNGKCQVEFDPNRELRVSSSEKSIIVATTGGAKTIHVDDDGNEVKLSCTVYKVNKGRKLPEFKASDKENAEVKSILGADIAKLVRQEIAKAVQSL